MSGKWTDEEEQILIELYGKGMTFVQMRDKNELMKRRYQANKMSLRDKVLVLQKKRIREGIPLNELEKQLSAGKHDYRNYAEGIRNGNVIVRKRKSPNLEIDKKRVSLEGGSTSIFKCPNVDCTKNFTSSSLCSEGLTCSCNVTLLQMIESVEKLEGTKIYIVQSKEKTSLTEQVLYVGEFDKSLFESSGYFSQKRICVFNKFPNFVYKKLFGLSGTALSNSELERIEIQKIQRQVSDDYKNLALDEYVNLDKSFFSTTELKKLKSLVEYVDSAGIVMNLERDDMKEFCFKKGNNKCKCPLKCHLRRYWNVWKRESMDLNICVWSPLAKEEVKNVCDDIPNYRFKRRIGPEQYSYSHSLEFYTIVCKRNQLSSEDEIQKVTKEISVLFKKGFLNYEVWSNPLLFVKQLLVKHAMSTTVTKLKLLRKFLRNMTGGELGTMFGSQYLRIIGMYNSMYYLFEKKLTERLSSGEKSIRQESNFVPWSKLGEVLEKLEQLKHKSPYDFQRCLGLKLYLKQQVIRNEYAILLFERYDEEKDNYIDFEEDKMVINSHKCSKELGQLVFQISDDVLEDLLKMRTIRSEQGRNYFFETSKKIQMTREKFGLMIRNITMEYLGKSIGSQMLRTMFVTEQRKDEMTVKESSEMSRKMLHKESISRSVYRKL